MGVYPQPDFTPPADQDATERIRFKISLVGISLTGVTAFVLAWVAHRLRTFNFTDVDPRRALPHLFVLVAFTTVIFVLVRQQWLKYVRSQAIDNASALVANAQNFNTVASSAIALIQEVELVSRGYGTYVYICGLINSVNFSQKRSLTPNNPT